jgi:hypothetical protein
MLLFTYIAYLVENSRVIPADSAAVHRTNVTFCSFTPYDAVLNCREVEKATDKKKKPLRHNRLEKNHQARNIGHFRCGPQTVFNNLFTRREAYFRVEGRFQHLL